MTKIRIILAALLAVAFLVTSAPSVSADTGDTSTSVCGGTGNPCPPPPCGGTGNPCPPPPCGGTGNPCPVVPDPCATPQSVTDGLAALLADNVALTGQVANLRTTNAKLRAKIQELRQKIRQLR